MKAIDRLYIYLENQNIKPTNFEREIGFSSGYLSNMRKRNADIGESLLNKVIDYCHLLSPEWLLTGKGEMLREEKLECDQEEKVREGPVPGGCLQCREKDKTIAELKEQLIATQGAYIELLKEQSPRNSGQKRKAS